MLVGLRRRSKRFLEVGGLLELEGFGFESFESIGHIPHPCYILFMKSIGIT